MLDLILSQATQPAQPPAPALSSIIGLLTFALALIVSRKESVAAWLGPYLDKIGGGWKVIVGVAGILVIMILAEVGWINGEVYTGLYAIFAAVTGIGIIHKDIRANAP